MHSERDREPVPPLEEVIGWSFFNTGSDNIEGAFKTVPGGEACSRMGHFQISYPSFLGISELASDTLLRKS